MRRLAGRQGFSLLELLIVIAIIALALGLLLPIASKARAASRQVACLANLQHISLGFHLYAQDEGYFPDPSATQVPWERSLSKYLPLDTFQCPSDAELAPSTGSSYDWRDTGIDVTTLAGRAARDVQRTGTVLAMEALPGWHAKGQMNAVLASGAAVTMPDQACLADLDLPVTITGSPIPVQGPGILLKQ